MTEQQEQLVLHILSQLHKTSSYKTGKHPAYGCRYCYGMGDTPGQIDHARHCIHLLSKELAATLPAEIEPEPKRRFLGWLF
ncbi:MAG TPA: hypothetical protein VFV38_19270 [Ktedonobacteraceae bacterium]|nr:hypothetical protein [Ktedonobacteraceae bacterium]